MISGLGMATDMVINTITEYPTVIISRIMEELMAIKVTVETIGVGMVVTMEVVVIRLTQRMDNPMGVRRRVKLWREIKKLKTRSMEGKPVVVGKK